METIKGLNTNGPAIIATGVVFPILTTVAVALRFVSKQITGAPHGADDWLLLAALLIYIVAEALVIRCRNIKTLNLHRDLLLSLVKRT